MSKTTKLPFLFEFEKYFSSEIPKSVEIRHDRKNILSFVQKILIQLAFCSLVLSIMQKKVIEIYIDIDKLYSEIIN